ncbi:UDP-N-acetylmuramoyl-tripeptide--D-alanyl-D-alanine ligase [Undibacterium terreum]|uniref:UDP-N-acetylmuramoyl-tripeptide--D-alanyl-D-alanine ligase n=1 Tax=Undibacterium terreum TaxID=1224302 RepID=A0A916XKK5_9BURK|nr:UDP-N-acetylmuramoyl-tripeptide--D-alanyl-D-alanine ligase [Undibacterium terreum]GGC81743.1 UDP-N-acetylmuramoyl-tripeptide--D-alanyl-D-alanine ligase [Undibacterium terreum]
MRASLFQLQASLTSASATADAQVTGVSTDSRKVSKGELFVALRGEKFDAHDFLDQVVAQGAAAVVVEHVPAGLTIPALVVPDTKMALAEIARYWRRQFSLPVIGVTGSNGKTTVKEMIASILAAYAGAEHSLATSGNLNNEIGVPMTVLRLQSDHKVAVIELGMNHPGEIALLASIAEPTVGLVNNAQREHQEFMHTVEAVAEENGSVLRHLPADGVAVFPADDTYTGLWRAYAQESGQRRIVSFGLSADADVSASYVPNQFGNDMQIRIGGQEFAVSLAAAGLHNVRNALAAAACSHSVGISNDIIARGLEAFSPVNGRLQKKQALNGASVIDDTYNANPDSVRAAIDVLVQAGSSSILVLGDMGEVGADGTAFHEEIGAYAKQRGIGQFLTLGTLARHAATAFGPAARHFESIEQLLATLDGSISSASTVLVKGSRFMKMERVIQHLTQQTAQQSTGSH